MTNTNNHGGRRPNSGAPRGNFNALKSGAHSPRLRAALEALVRDDNFRLVLQAAREGVLPRNSLRDVILKAATNAGFDRHAFLNTPARAVIRRYADQVRAFAIDDNAREELRTEVARLGPTIAGLDASDPHAERLRARLDRLAARARLSPGPPVYTSVLDDPHSEWCIEGNPPQ